MSARNTNSKNSNFLLTAHSKKNKIKISFRVLKFYKKKEIKNLQTFFFTKFFVQVLKLPTFAIKTCKYFSLNFLSQSYKIKHLLQISKNLKISNF